MKNEICECGGLKKHHNKSKYPNFHCKKFKPKNYVIKNDNIPNRRGTMLNKNERHHNP